MTAVVNTTRSEPTAKSRIDWTPYLTGTGIGILSWAAFAIANDPLGITTALSAVAGFFVMPFTGAETVWRNPYWAEDLPSLSYSSLFLVGVILGGFAAALSARQFRIESVPATWRRRFGASTALRSAAAFVGGGVEMYGARLAGGCASGHGISGTLQLALSSWVFTILMFATAVLFGSFIFGQRRSKA